MELIKIFKGDDTDFIGNQRIVISLHTYLDLSNCKAHFQLLDFKADFDTIPEDKKLEIVIDRELTAKFPLGLMYATVWIEDVNHKRRTVANRIAFEITNCVGKAYDWHNAQKIDLDITLQQNDGTARPLPDYLYALDFFDSYKAEAEAFYEEFNEVPAACSGIVKDGKFGRNFDWTYDNASSFVVRMAKVGEKHASIGVANVGSKLSNDFVKTGKWSKYYKVLPGMTTDGINDAGLYAAIFVVHKNGSAWETGHATAERDLCVLGAVRYALDNFDDAGEAAGYLADHIYIPQKMLDLGYSFQFIIGKGQGYFVWLRDGLYEAVSFRALTNNRRINDPYGTGYERLDILQSHLEDNVSMEDILASVNFSLAYVPNSSGDYPRPTEFAGESDELGLIPHTDTERLQAWAKAHITPILPYARNKGFWQSVHSAIYDFETKTMKIAVQESGDYYTFGMIGSGTGGTITLDNTVTQSSSNGVKSSGIWSWCKATFAAISHSHAMNAITGLVGTLLMKADAEENGAPNGTITGELNYGSGVGFVYSIYYSNGKANSINGWWGKESEIGVKINEFTDSLDSVISQGSAISRFALIDGVFYEILIDLMKEVGEELRISILDPQTRQSINNARYLVNSPQYYSVIDSLTKHLKNRLSDTDLDTLCTACGITTAGKTRAQKLFSLFGEDNSKLIETIEEHSGGGDTTFCLKYDPENDVFYYDDGEPETSNQGE